LAAELVDRKVGVIVATPGTIEAARQATQSIPIVFTGGADPVASGLVASLARPGGNITGMTFALPEMAGKRVALLKEAFPKISRLAVLWSPDNEGGAQDWQETKAAALALDYRVAIVGGQRSQRFPSSALSDDSKAPSCSHHVRIFPHERVSPNHRGIRQEAAATDDVWAAGGCGGGRSHVVCPECRRGL